MYFQFNNQSNNNSYELIEKYCNIYETWEQFLQDLYQVRKQYHFKCFPESYHPFIEKTINESLSPVYRVIVICHWILGNNENEIINNELNNTWKNHVLFIENDIHITFGNIENYFSNKDVLME